MSYILVEWWHGSELPVFSFTKHFTHLKTAKKYLIKISDNKCTSKCDKYSVFKQCFMGVMCEWITHYEGEDWSVCPAGYAIITQQIGDDADVDADADASTSSLK